MTEIETQRPDPKRARRLGAAALAITLALAAPPVTAQELVENSAAFKDWSVFVDKDSPQKFCWAATVPTESKASRDGVTRGDVYLTVSTFPSENVSNEIGIRLGFPADPNKELTLKIGDSSFAFFSDGEEAWIKQDQEGAALAAMRAGATAVVTSTSTRGTVLTDTFSLIGFSNAMERMGELCR